LEDLNFLNSSFKKEFLVEEKPLILIVEDDQTFAKSIQFYLTKKCDLHAQIFINAKDCLEFIEEEALTRFCLLADIGLGGEIDGLNLIDRVKDLGVEFASIIMTGFGTIESAINATKKGVYHYLTKPFELESLSQIVKECLVKELRFEEESFLKSNSQENPKSPYSSIKQLVLGTIKIEEPQNADLFCSMVGRSQKMKYVFERIQKVAKSNSTVLITGPSGTGKELVAGAIHRLSPRKEARQVNVNCGAIPADLLESELFGHIKGAFTGAISDRAGRFELANQGSIFLDEIGDMPLALQVKLLRVLQTKKIEPVGGNKSFEIDVRLMAATHRDLEELSNDGKFREDLFYRLNVIPIRIPALKERREDIPLLIGHFLKKFVSADKSNEIKFDEKALDIIMTYDWPGNVRELENLVERLVILRGGHCILPEDLPAKLYRSNPLESERYRSLFELPEDGVDLKKVLSEIEESLILQALEKTSGNKNQASKLLSLNRTTLIEKLKKKSIDLH
jgi:DNA-binding NtrC family response regulator